VSRPKKLRRVPTAVGTLATFLLAGPFIAGLVITTFVALFAGDLSAHGGATSASPLAALKLGLGWFRSIFIGPIGWFFTIIPTALAAVIYWALTKLSLSSRPFSTRAAVIALGCVTGIVAAILGWGTSILVLFKFDLMVALGSFIFVWAMVLPTGALLGLAIGAWSSGERPNSTVERTGRKGPAPHSER
jgi:hypothetical protein